MAKPKSVQVIVRVRPNETSQRVIDIPENQEKSIDVYNIPKTARFKQHDGNPIRSMIETNRDQQETDNMEDDIFMQQERMEEAVKMRKAQKKLHAFTYDRVAGPETTNQVMFDDLVEPLIDSCLAGYNGTIFCYGQTGSGKTYTMTGPPGVSLNHPEAGMIPRTLQNLFEKIHEKQNEGENQVQFLIHCSFLEIYNEQIKDLLGSFDKNLTLRENIRTGVYVEGLKQERVTSPNEALTLLSQGLKIRHTGRTNMNEYSSRSHSVFTLYVQSREIGQVTRTTVAQLNLIDLAGSERVEQTGTTGLRLTEACSINRSLSALGKVINALSEQAKGRSAYIHYRDSKLTFLLRDSLGGNSRTMIVANISGSHYDLNETVSTLKFAKRAKRVRNQPIQNEKITGNVAYLQDQLKKLKAKCTAQEDSLKRYYEWEQTGYQPENSFAWKMKGEDETLAQYVQRLEELLLHNISRVRRIEESKVSCFEKMTKLKQIIESKEKLFLAARSMLKLKEVRLASHENRTPNLKLLHRRYVQKLSDLQAQFMHNKLSKDQFDENDFMLDDDTRDHDFTEEIVFHIDQVADDDDTTLPQSIEKFEGDSLKAMEQYMKYFFEPDHHPLIAHFVVENMDLKEQVAVYEEVLHTQNESYIAKLNACQLDLERQIKELVQNKHIHDKQKAYVHELEQQLHASNKKIKELENKATSEEETFQTHIANLENELQEVWKHRTAAERAESMLSEKLEFQTNIVNALNQQLASVNADFEKTKQYAQENKILSNEHHSENAELLQSNESLRKQLADLDASFKAYKADAKSKTSYHEKQIKKLERYSNRLEKKLDSTTNSANALDDLRKELTSEHELHIASIKASHEKDLASQKSAMESSFASQRQAMDQKQSQFDNTLQHLTSTNLQLQSELELAAQQFQEEMAIANKRSTQHTQSLESRVDVLQQTIDAMETDKASLVQREQHHVAKMKELDAQVAQLKTTLEHQQQHQSSLDDHAEELMLEKLAELQYEHTQAVQENNSLKSELAKFKRNGFQDGNHQVLLDRIAVLSDRLEKQGGQVTPLKRALRVTSQKENRSPYQDFASPLAHRSSSKMEDE